MLHYVKFKSQIGIALIAVLVFMQIFSMLSWYFMENVLLEIKMARQVWQRQSLFHVAEYLLHQVEAGSPNCLVPVTATEILSHEPLTWWQSAETCAGNFQKFQYYYVTEFLGNDPCAVIGHAAADYYRITLLAMMKTGGSQVLLQGTMIKPNIPPVKCESVSHQVRPGEQSWREL